MFECVEIKSDEITSYSSVSNKLTDTEKRIFKVILSNVQEDPADFITVDTKFSSTGIDSISFIKTIVALEEEFGFEFDDDMLYIDKFPSIQTMIEYVESKI